MDPRENEDVKRVEETLRQFSPRSIELDREQFMFLAGQASVERPASPAPAGWLWPLSTLAMSGLAACLAVVLFTRAAPEPTERIVYRDVIRDTSPTSGQARAVVAIPASVRPPFATTPVSLSLPPQSVLQMRNVALRWGVEALPSGSAAASAGSQPTSVELWHEFREAKPASSAPSL